MLAAGVAGKGEKTRPPAQRRLVLGGVWPGHINCSTPSLRTWHERLRLWPPAAASMRETRERELDLGSSFPADTFASRVCDMCAVSVRSDRRCKCCETSASCSCKGCDHCNQHGRARRAWGILESRVTNLRGFLCVEPLRRAFASL